MWWKDRGRKERDDAEVRATGREGKGREWTGPKEAHHGGRQGPPDRPGMEIKIRGRPVRRE